MGQDYEFNVRYVRGKGIQIIPLRTIGDRFFWMSVGAMASITWVALLFQFAAADRAVEFSYAIVAFFAGYQTRHLWVQHQRMKAMLKEIGMTEKQMLATVGEIIKEGEANLEKMKREAAEKLDELERESEAKWGPKD